MEKQKLSEQELKLTAAIYAARPGVVDYLKETGKLPESIPTGGANIGARILIRERGTDITLTENEQLVYDAIKREGRLPGGCVMLVE